MESIYEWLLHNIGNEGNYLTILNVERHQTEGDTSSLDVMARTNEFNVLNLLIKEGSATGESLEFKERVVKDSYLLPDANQVIAYLSAGTVEEPSAGSESSAFHVYVLEPVGEAGPISFPPTNAEA